MGLVLDNIMDAGFLHPTIYLVIGIVVLTSVGLFVRVLSRILSLCVVELQDQEGLNKDKQI